MKRRFWRSKWFIVTIIIITVILLSLFVALRIDFGQREDAVLNTFRKRKACPKHLLNWNN